MSASFDPALPRDLDTVRLLIGDTDEASARVQDETILALLTQAVAQGASATGAPYCAAAQAGEVLVSRWTVEGQGIVEKQVKSLRIRRSESQSAADAYREYLKSLKSTCTRLSLSSPGVLKAW